MKIIALIYEEGEGVNFYRIYQPYGYLKTVLGKDISIYNNVEQRQDQDHLRSEIDQSDIIVFINPYMNSQLELIEEIINRRDKNQKVVVDYDDDYFNISFVNPAYCLFGTKEISKQYFDRKINDELTTIIRDIDKELIQTNQDGSTVIYVWKDKHTSYLCNAHGEVFNIKANQSRLKTIRTILHKADLVTVTTEQLAKAISKYRPQGKISVLPNLVDLDRFIPMKNMRDDKLRIIWQGGSAHYLDLMMVKNELVSFSRKHPEVEYVFKGVKYPTIFQEIKDKVTWLPWHSDINTYPLSLTELSGDIAICPLIDDAYNNGKSPLKWEEMSAMKVPCVCSPIVYGNYIEQGKTGFIARTGEWGTYLEKLLDPALRKQIGQGAYDVVKKGFSIENASMYWSILQKLF